jgi:hypothetical protein
MNRPAETQSRTRQSLSRIATAGCVSIIALLTLWRVGHSSTLPPATVRTIATPSFAADGDLHLPDGFRRWEHVGSRVKTSGKSVLDGAVILRPQVMDTYVEPSAFVQYKQTGVWPDGTQIVKEISITRSETIVTRSPLLVRRPPAPASSRTASLGLG